jgi:hypothetical protein
MGLDISAYSHLRFRTKDVPEEWDGEDGSVLVPFVEDHIERLDGMPTGLYDPTDEIRLWWHAEHGTYAIPASEVAQLETRIAGLQGGSVKAECPGDLAVLAEDRPVSNSTGFRAGSYSGYNWWREQLCKFALEVSPEDVWEEPERFEGKAFVELINFSDCDGCIGSKTSAKLAKDFAAHAPRLKMWATKHLTDADERSYFVDSYAEWQQGFELAAQNGVLIFH